MTNREFIVSISEAAIKDMEESGILASITVGQACLESGYGKSKLATEAKNLFGMKAMLSGNTWASDWDGATYTIETKEQDESGKEHTVTEEFRKYSSVEQSVKDHSDYLTGAKNGSSLRYAGLSGCKNYRTAAQILKDGGYATDTSYVKKLCDVIEANHLTQYDGGGQKVKICLDAGHYGKYNQSPADPNYYESEIVWKLHLLLKENLEKYGIEVLITRDSQVTDREVYERGKVSVGCSLFLSLHTNASGTGRDDSVDYPVSLCAINGSADKIGLELAQCVEAVMGTKQRARTEHKRGSHGDYYGVLRGATDVGTPGLILEHSFHTNESIVQWLLHDENLDKMAKAEAAAIAEHYRINVEEAENKSGWYQEDGGWRFYLGNTGDYVRNAWYQDGEDWYWFDGAGMMVSNNWKTGSDGKWYYLTGSGAMAKNNWTIWRNDLYRLTEDGSMFERRLRLSSDEKGALQLYHSAVNNMGYIKDGLIFCLNGVYNTREGHDGTVTTFWHDLSGNDHDPMLFSSQGGISFGDAYCHLKGGYFKIERQEYAGCR